jgi:hypothetical protein
MQHKEFLHDHVLGGDRVALDRLGSRRMKKHETAQTLSSAFALIAALSRNAIVADQTLVVTARLDRAPAHRFVIKERAARPLVVSAFRNARYRSADAAVLAGCPIASCATEC